MNDNKDEYTDNYMILFDQALELIEKNARQISFEEVSLRSTSGRILAEDIYSDQSIPPFNNSAMDGYAVNYSDLKSATKENPIELKLKGLTAAGDGVSDAGKTIKTAWKIMTGAPIPKGYDSIIPVENTSLDENNKIIRCFSSPQKGAHVRSSGEDFTQGQLVLKESKIINSNRIMALASLGIAKVKVVNQPTIAVFSTGKELVNDPNKTLELGQIRNSNSPYILDFLQQYPVEAYNAGTNYDEVDAYQLALEKELKKGTNIIISTGAVSMGDFDFIPQTILKMGGEIIFHKIKIRPGKPILFAKFPNGTFYFGLPGNPISATIGLRFFVTHLIHLMLGLDKELPLKCRLKNGRSKKQGFKNILKAHSKIDSDAVLNAEIMDGQESFKIHPLIDANGWIILDENMQSAKENDLVKFYFSQPNLNEL